MYIRTVIDTAAHHFGEDDPEFIEFSKRLCGWELRNCNEQASELTAELRLLEAKQRALFDKVAWIENKMAELNAKVSQ